MAGFVSPDVQREKKVSVAASGGGHDLAQYDQLRHEI